MTVLATGAKRAGIFLGDKVIGGLTKLAGRYPVSKETMELLQRSAFASGIAQEASGLLGFSLKPIISLSDAPIVGKYIPRELGDITPIDIGLGVASAPVEGGLAALAAGQFAAGGLVYVGKKLLDPSSYLFKGKPIFHANVSSDSSFTPTNPNDIGGYKVGSPEYMIKNLPFVENDIKSGLSALGANVEEKIHSFTDGLRNEYYETLKEIDKHFPASQSGQVESLKTKIRYIQNGYTSLPSNSEEAYREIKHLESQIEDIENSSRQRESALDAAKEKLETGIKAVPQNIINVFSNPGMGALGVVKTLRKNKKINKKKR